MFRIFALLILTWTAVPLYADDLTTLDGKTYQNVSVVGVGDDSINITYKGGSAEIPYYNLPVEMQKQYGKDAESRMEAKKDVDSAAINQKAAEEDAKRLADEQKKQKADELVKTDALSAARKNHKIQLSEESLRSPDTKSYSDGLYSYDKYFDTSYLDSPSATATPLPVPSATDPLAGHAALIFRTVTLGPKPEKPDKLLAIFLSVSIAKKLSNPHQVIFIVDGNTMYIAQPQMKDINFYASSAGVVEYVSFYLTKEQTESIVNAKQVIFCVGPNDYTLQKGEQTKLKDYWTSLDKELISPTSIVKRKYREFVMSLPPLPILISDICIYILTGSFLVVVLLGLFSALVGASRFFKL